MERLFMESRELSFTVLDWRCWSVWCWQGSIREPGLSSVMESKGKNWVLSPSTLSLSLLLSLCFSFFWSIAVILCRIRQPVKLLLKDVWQFFVWLRLIRQISISPQSNSVLREFLLLYRILLGFHHRNSLKMLHRLGPFLQGNGIRGPLRTSLSRKSYISTLVYFISPVLCFETKKTIFEKKYPLQYRCF